MKILAIDTSSKICGVCILEDKQEVYREDIITDRSHSIKLMPVIKDAFNNTNLNISDIDLIVCDKGPGSFTGIRIGVATAKAFSDSLDIPLIGVNSLETLAYNFIDEDKLVCSILDARNDNCYFSLYQCNSGNCENILEPMAVSLEDAIQKLMPYSKSTITFVGDGVNVFKDKLLSAFPNSNFSECNTLNSYSLGLAGYSKYTNKNFEDALPLYLKKPQAERQLEEKLNESTNS